MRHCHCGPPRARAPRPTKDQGNRVKRGPEKERPSFFEKKKQKTFDFFDLAADLSHMQRGKVPKNKSFLVLFFKKEHLPFLVTYLADRLVSCSFLATPFQTPQNPNM
jgi:hypothetical protein